MNSYFYRFKIKILLVVNRNVILALLLFFTLPWMGCASLNTMADAFGGLFRGNLKKDPADYTLDEKREYKKYLYQKKLEKKHKEQEILERLK